MGDTIIQKRTYELEEYTQLIPGEPGYEDPATVFLPLDKLGWAEAKKFSLVEFIANLHLERGPASVTSTSVVVEYNSNFTVPNYYIKVDAWRVVTIPGVGDVRENIPIIDFNPSLSGFTLTLESYQAGDNVDFIAFE